MKRIIFSLLMATATLSAAPQAVVFDWGKVISFDNRNVVVDFVCDSFKFSKEEFEKANLEKKKAMKEGKSETDFWLQLAKERGVQLPKNWPKAYVDAIKESVGVDPAMIAMVDALKDNHIRVGLLSNIDNRYGPMIRGFGFYDRFDPCLLSFEMGVEKPEKKAYDIMLNSLNLPAGDVVFIDDKPENIEAAKALGIDGIVFESSQQIRNELINRGALK